jgi:predicted permease
MHEYLQILGGVIPLFLLMGVGAVLRRIRILTEEADRSLLDLCVHILLPCLILDHIMANEALRRSGNLLWSPLLGFVVTAGSIGFAALVARLWRFPRKEAKTFGFVAGIFNYGYIPVPLIATLYGANALGVLFLFNLGTEMAFWVVGFSLLTGHTILSDFRRALTSPVRAIILGVSINLITECFGLRLDSNTLDTLAWGWPVKVIFDTIHFIGLCSIPLALLLIGATMADFWCEFKANIGIGVMALSFLVRNAIVPLGFVVVAWALPVSQELKETLVVQAAMPAGVFTLLLSRHHGGSVPVALQVIFSSSAAAIITLPLWIHFGMKLIGLSGGSF